MKRIFCIIILFSFSRQVLGQTNLVPNPSFETKSQCPQSYDNIPDATGWFSAGVSPDYFHSCANPTLSIMGMPSNFGGSQYAYDGNAYAGLATFSSQIPNIREYVSIQLSTPLVMGTKYYASAFISRGDSIYGGQNVGCASNKFGFKFSTISKSALAFNPALTDNFSHIKSDSIIKDKLNWTPIKGSFIADSAYKYVIIGNFYNDLNTDTLSCPDLAYYYLDMVCVSTNSLNCAGFTGIKNNSETLFFQIFPNPVNSVLKIQLDDYEKSIMTLFNSSGFEKFNEVIYKNAELDISTLPDGFYFLQLQNSRGKTVEKVIIRH